MTETTMQHAPPALSVPKGLRMLQLNQVRLSGRLTHDPKIRAALPDAVIVQMNVAVNRPYRTASGKWRKQVVFVPITVWNSLAENCLNRLRKGSSLYIEGRLRSDSWKTDDGLARCALRVEASKVQFLSKENRQAAVSC